MPAVAMTDHGNVCGAFRFVNACRKEGVKPIVGMEAYYTITDRSAKERDDLNQVYYHLVLLALNNQGLHNLIKLSSRAYTEGFYHKPRLDDTLLAEHADGLCATTACLGSRASQLILNHRTSEAERLIDHHYALFGGRLFVEVQLHEGEQEQVNQALLKIATRKGLPPLLTNDCHYLRQEDHQLHEIALCLQTGAKLSDPNRFRFGDIDVHMASPEWMWERAAKMGIPEEALTNTIWLAEKVDSDSYFSDVLNRYPTAPGVPEGVTADQYLEWLCKQKLTERFGGMPPEPYRERIDYELKTIKQLGFSDYMLIVEEITRIAEENEIASGPGRGSVGGSLVAYALGITKADPLRHGLLFERFLNWGRGSTPVIFG